MFKFFLQSKHAIIVYVKTTMKVMKVQFKSKTLLVLYL